MAETLGHNGFDLHILWKIIWIFAHDAYKMSDKNYKFVILTILNSTILRSESFVPEIKKIIRNKQYLGF